MFLLIPLNPKCQSCKPHIVSNIPKLLSFNEFGFEAGFVFRVIYLRVVLSVLRIGFGEVVRTHAFVRVWFETA